MRAPSDRGRREGGTKLSLGYLKVSVAGSVGRRMSSVAKAYNQNGRPSKRRDLRTRQVRLSVHYRVGGSSASSWVLGNQIISRCSVKRMRWIDSSTLVSCACYFLISGQLIDSELDVWCVVDTRCWRAEFCGCSSDDSALGRGG